MLNNRVQLANMFIKGRHVIHTVDEVRPCCDNAFLRSQSTA